jgi:hypothetical protein
MAEGANIGAATVVFQTGEAAPDKYQSYMRSMMRSTAEANGRNPKIAEAMVDQDLSVDSISEKGKNKVFDDDWANYFPRAYKSDGGTFKTELNSEEQLIQESTNTFWNKGVDTKPVTLSLNDRTLEGEALPQNKVIDFNIINAFTKNAKQILFDEHTIKQRYYSQAAINSKKLNNADIFADVSVAKTLQQALIRLDNNSKRLLINYNTKEGITWKKALQVLQRNSVTDALGGAFQLVKQYSTAVATAANNLGENADYIFKAQKDIITDEFARELVAQSSTGKRDLGKLLDYKSLELKSKDLSLFKTRVKGLAGRVGRKALDYNKKLNEFSLKSLQFGDFESARAAWLAYYADYLYKEGLIQDYGEINWSIESAKPNKEAMAYAEGLVSDSLNTSSALMSPDVKMPFLLAPFSGFAINDFINTATAIDGISGKLKRGDTNITTELNFLKGTVASKVLFNLIGYASRQAAIVTMGGIAGAMILGDDELDEEDKKRALKAQQDYQEKAIEQNKDNSQLYFWTDIFFGNVMGNYSQKAVQVGIDLFSAEDKATAKFAEDPLALFGGYSVYPKVVFNFSKQAISTFESDEEYRKRKYGFINSETGKEEILTGAENLKKPKLLTTMNRMALAANAIQVLGLSDQTVGSVARQSKKIVRELENELDKTNKKLKLDVPEEELFKKIIIKDTTFELDENQRQQLLKVRKEAFKTYPKTVGQLLSRARGFITNQQAIKMRENYASAMARRYFIENIYPKMKGKESKESLSRAEENLIKQRRR